MNSQTCSFSKSTLALAAFALAATVAAICFAATQPEKDSVKSNSERGSSPAGFYETIVGCSKVVFNVEGMSCSGCVSTIESSLSRFEGIKKIIVDVSAGKTEVYFDSRKLRDIEKLSAAITASGYPAKIDVVVSAEEVKKGLDQIAARSRLYLASVGSLDISRSEFNAELEYAKRRYARTYSEGAFSAARGKVFLDRLKAQTMSRMITEAAQLQGIQEDGYKLDEATVNQEFGRFLEERGLKLDDFKASLKENGDSLDQFMKKFERRLLVKRYLDEEIFSGASNEFEKRRRYSSWVKSATLLAKVVYYDKDLELLVKSQSGNRSCSGTCSSAGTGKGKGSCCSTKPRAK